MACYAKGMRVALFEQVSLYALCGGPIQIQSNVLRMLQRINPTIYEELVSAGTCTADRVSGLKIGYRKGNKLSGLYNAGDWPMRFDTVGPAIEAGLPATVGVDRTVVEQILGGHGFPEGTVHVDSRIESFEDLCGGRGAATLKDGIAAQADVLVGADGHGSQVQKEGGAGQRQGVPPRQGQDRHRGQGRTKALGLEVLRRTGAAPRVKSVSYQILLKEKKCTSC